MRHESHTSADSSQCDASPVHAQDPSGRPATTTPGDRPVVADSLPPATAEGARLVGRRRPIFRELTGMLSSLTFHLVVLLALSWLVLPLASREGAELVITSVEGEDARVESFETETADGQNNRNDGAAPSPALNWAPNHSRVEDIQLDLTAGLVASTVRIDAAAIDAILESGLADEIAADPGEGFKGRSRENRLLFGAKKGMTAESEEAVARALEWLVRHQLPDGGWSFDHTTGACQGRCGNAGLLARCRTGATGLALMTLLGAGETHISGQYQRQVRDAIYYLVNQIQPTQWGGSLTNGHPNGGLYDHAIAAIALCEAYGMTQDRALRRPAQRAVDFIVASQDPIGGGWRYTPGGPGDTSVVSWHVMALKSAHMSYLQIPPATIRGAGKFLDSVQSDRGATYGYIGPGDGRASNATSAAGLLSRMYLGWDRERGGIRRGVIRLARMGPSPTNMYYNYYATQVLYHNEGKEWERWNKQLRDYLIAAQSRAGHERGSWFFSQEDVESDEHLDRGVRQGGRHYFTCICCMTLEVYYRYLPIYRDYAVESGF